MRGFTDNSQNLTILNALYDDTTFEEDDGDRKSIYSSNDDESGGKRG